MTNPENQKSLIPNVIKASNNVITQRENNPGSPDHADAMHKLTQLVANDSNALAVLSSLQKES